MEETVSHIAGNVRVCPQCLIAFDEETDSKTCPHDLLRLQDRLSRLKTTDPRIRELFHLLWTKAVGQPRYIKKEWMELRQELYDQYGIYL